VGHKADVVNETLKRAADGQICRNDIFHLYRPILHSTLMNLRWLVVNNRFTGNPTPERIEE